VSGRSPASAIFHTPESWLWLYIVQPWSKRVRSALPRGVIDSIRRPRRSRSKRLRPGNANSALTSGSPATAAARRSAARRISGPSGTGPSDRLHAAAVHGQADAVDVSGGRRTQERDHPAGLAGVGEAARGHGVLHVAAHLVLAAPLAGGAVADQLADAAGLGKTGQHVVDGDPVRAQLAGQ